MSRALADALLVGVKVGITEAVARAIEAGVPDGTLRLIEQNDICDPDDTSTTMSDGLVRCPTPGCESLVTPARVCIACNRPGPSSTASPRAQARDRADQSNASIAAAASASSRSRPHEPGQHRLTPPRHRARRPPLALNARSAVLSAAEAQPSRLLLAPEEAPLHDGLAERTRADTALGCPRSARTAPPGGAGFALALPGMADSRPPQTRAELVSFSPGGRVTEAAPNDAGSFMIVVGRPSFLQAKALMKARQWSAAVVAAHAISEVYVLQIFEELMGHAGLNEITFDRCPSMAFYTRNRPLLEWYEKLSGDRSYREQPFWVSGRLTAHVDRRHRIAHAGYVCDRAEAEESLAVVDELSSHLEGVLETVKAKPSPYRKPE